MWKYAVGFFAFAGLALWVMTKSGPVDLGGEHAAQEAMHKGDESHSAAPAAAPAAAPVVPAAAPAAPAAEAAAAPAAPAVAAKQ